MSTTIKSFFDRQKHDLSDKSNKDDQKKKKNGERERQSGLNTSLSKDETDVFEEGIESPCCAGILYNCLQNLEKKGKRYF